LVDGFRETAKTCPNNVAIIYKDKTITYKQLDLLSNVVANYILAHCNVHNNDCIGLLLNRSEFMIIAIIGVLKSGCAYVPISDKYPKNRISYIINKAKIKVLISDIVTSGAQYTLSIDKIFSENNTKSVKVKIRSTDLDYIIFTSGTTGNPKGVAMTHGATTNTINSIHNKHNFSKLENVLFSTEYVFDVSVEQLFLALLFGYKLIVT
jgi:non-ribosomal peptide synthetase component F